MYRYNCINMRTTVDLPDDLFRQAKIVAAREGVTLRSLIESGLRSELARRRTAPYRLPDFSFGGNGMAAGIDEGDWPTIRDIIYDDPRP